MASWPNWIIDPLLYCPSGICFHPFIPTSFKLCALFSGHSNIPFAFNCHKDCFDLICWDCESPASIAKRFKHNEVTGFYPQKIQMTCLHRETLILLQKLCFYQITLSCRSSGRGGCVAVMRSSLMPLSSADSFCATPVHNQKS